MAPTERSQAGQNDDESSRKLPVKLLNRIISNRGCDAHLAREERRIAYRHVVNLSKKAQDHQTGDLVDYDTERGRKLLELAVEQAFDEVTNGDIDRISRRLHRPATADPMILGSLESPYKGDDPTGRACEKELQWVFQAKINGLPDLQRRAIELRRKGCSCREIGELLDCSPNTANLALLSAIEALSKALESFE